MAGILIIGGGFSGTWSAASAAKLREQRGISEQALPVTVVSAGDDLVIRPRLYERDPERMRVPLDRILGPAGVRRIAATVTGIDPARREVTGFDRDGGETVLTYDRLVLAAGSRLIRPSVPGAEHLYDVDTLGGAAALEARLRRLPALPDEGAGQYTVVVVGAGFTGLEIATELVDRLGELAPPGRSRVVLVEREDRVGPELGPGPRPVIEAALGELGVEVRAGVAVRAVEPGSVRLSDGSVIDARTVVWTAGMTASPLTRMLSAERDGLGRLAVDEHLRVRGLPEIFAAGDTAAARADEEHPVMQSCQHAVPLGKFAGHNAAADLLAEPLVPFAPTSYVTCLALGPAGAVLTAGWERQVQLTGKEAKELKSKINEEWIYPPVDDAAALFALAGPNAEWPKDTEEASTSAE